VQTVKTPKSRAAGNSVAIRLSGFAGWLQRQWEKALDLWAVLKPCRFSVFMVLVGFAFLILAPQGRDTLREFVEARAIDARYITEQLLFLAAVLLWAIYSWYFARQLLTFRFASSPAAPKRNPTQQDLRVRHLCFVVPRWLGTICFVIVGAAYMLAAFAYRDTVSSQYFLPMVVIGAAYIVAAFVFRWVVTHRRDIQQWMFDHVLSYVFPGGRVRAIGAALFVPEAAAQQQFFVHTRLTKLDPGTWIWIGLSAATAFALFCAFLFAPVVTGQFLGAATITLIAASGWIVFGSALVYIGSRLRFPVVTLLIGLALLFSLWNDNHAIRLAQAEPAPRPTLEQRFDAWLQAMDASYPGRQRHPLIVVAAEGGGIRAAYWTAAVLSELQDNNDSFAAHVFAISGVSGGSVGGSVFAALVADQAQHQLSTCRHRRGTERDDDALRRCAHRILSQDFLGPVVGALLYPDLVQRISPIVVPIADRARALEDAWSDAWRRVVPASDRFADPLQQLWADPKTNLAVPALLLNATWVERGKRVIASNLQIAPEIFADAVDVYDVIGKDLPLAAAAHLSARFTYVSPAGTLIEKEKDEKQGKQWGHVVDGGYFENSGGTAVLELLTALQKQAGWERVRPIVISITNEPVPDGAAALKNYEPSEWRPFASETLSPFRALLNTRDARGIHARAGIAQFVASDKNGFHRFELCQRDVPLPLGWQLSRLAEQEIQEQLSGKQPCNGNAERLKRIDALLPAPRPAQQLAQRTREQ
jgi:hypothetical protein